MSILKTPNRLYEGVDINVSLLSNLNVKGIKELSYEANRPNASLQHGQGVKHIGYTLGPRQLSGSIEFYENEVRAIQRAALVQGYQFLDEIPPFEIGYTLLNEEQGPASDLLVARFTSNPGGGRTEDGPLMRALQLLVIDIKFNV